MAEELTREYMDNLIRSVKGNLMDSYELRTISSEFARFFMEKSGVYNYSDLVVNVLYDMDACISTIYTSKQFFSRMVQSCVARVLEAKAGEYYVRSMVPGKYMNALHFKYPKVELNDDAFIQIGLEDKMPKIISAFIIGLEQDQKMLASLYFVGDMSVSEISRMTNTSADIINSNMSWMFDQFKMAVMENQMTPGGSFYSLKDRNIYFETIENDFYNKYNQKFGFVMSSEKSSVSSEKTEYTMEQKPQEEQKLEKEVISKTNPVSTLNEEDDYKIDDYWFNSRVTQVEKKNKKNRKSSRR